MKKFVVIFGVWLSFGTNAQADVCYDIDEKAANKAVEIIRNQKEIYKYCSICPDAEPEIITVSKVQNKEAVYVNDAAIDVAHAYFKQGDKFVNLGVASGCIKAGEYNISAELDSFSTQINKKNKIKILQQKFINCTNTFEAEEKNCSELWRMKCYDHLMQANKNAQSCYKKIAIDLFKNYYDFSEIDAKKKVNLFQKFLYEQYSFIYNESKSCKRSNCGVSLYLYSEYATTQELQFYVQKIIGSLTARD